MFWLTKYLRNFLHWVIPHHKAHHKAQRVHVKVFCNLIACKVWLSIVEDHLNCTKGKVCKALFGVRCFLVSWIRSFWRHQREPPMHVLQEAKQLTPFK